MQWRCLLQVLVYFVCVEGIGRLEQGSKMMGIYAGVDPNCECYFPFEELLLTTICIVSLCLQLVPCADWCQVGLGICYDIRFAELAQLYSRKGQFLCFFLSSG